MKNLSRPMFLTLGLGLFALVLSFHPSNHAAAAPVGPSVTVLNTPLPVTGSVNAAVSGTVNANITNASLPVMGAVSITGTPSVGVIGNVPVVNPLDVLNNRVPMTISTATTHCEPLWALVAWQM